jgi:hypothetical protein
VIAFNRGIDAAANLLEAGLDTGVLQAKVGGCCSVKVYYRIAGTAEFAKRGTGTSEPRACLHFA